MSLVSSTKRKRILAYTKTVIEGISEIYDVDVGKVSPIDPDTVALPSAFIYAGHEQRIISGDYAVIGQETWRLPISIEIWATDATDLELMLGTVHQEMWSGQYMGGEAVQTRRTDADILLVDPTNLISALVVEFEIIYRHPKGAM